MSPTSEKQKQYMRDYQKKLVANNRFVNEMYDQDLTATEEALEKAHLGGFDISGVPTNEVVLVASEWILSNSQGVLALALDFAVRYGNMDVVERVNQTGKMFKSLADARTEKQRIDLAYDICEYIVRVFEGSLHNEHFPEDNRPAIVGVLTSFRHMKDLLRMGYAFRQGSLDKNKSTGLV